MSYRIRLLETEEGWAVSCLDLPGCHSQVVPNDACVALLMFCSTTTTGAVRGLLKLAVG